MEDIVDFVGYVCEGRGGNDGVGSDAVAADGERGNERGVGGSDQGGVAVELLQLFGTNENGSKF